MNLHDSEHVAGVLDAAGLEPSESLDDAQLVVFNTCCVRKSAEDRFWGNLVSVSADAARSGRVVAVCGCIAERYGVEILTRFPGVSLVFGMDRLESLPEMLARCTRSPLIDLGDAGTACIDHLPSRAACDSHAWVPVSHGCDNNCAYCVVPLVRGPERNRATGDILEEVRRLAACGVIEVTLLGQNVNSWRGEPAETFAGLLQQIAEVPGVSRVKFETSHPRDLDDRILEVMAGTPQVCEYLHLPVQSGSDAVLSAMGRGYGREFYLQRLALARELVDDISITTDVMVGFPGESEKDHADTVDLLRRARFDAAYLFLYSRRDGTRAAEMGKEVPRQVARRRFAELSILQEEITHTALEGMVSSRREVLLEGRARRGPLLSGRARGHQVVLVEPGACRDGSLVEVSITGAGRHTLRGRVEKVLRPGGVSGA
ncbi:MAG: tRNA (N6-isopentenyl adenosine(37)-C2)-methylthiotransferase MiaB [Actinobacteria bacterium]|nr:tRNA (N6-isopentenyl adenosine(37)-C2)-methylthiotransferase MiaB [Actinomycetota bacterium]MBU1942853.1 tRNA (N6-isopentenyl adenosine(37)-C2)-methylthiotransferase MiaB [Actinomycetota bacterium]MBU2687585.1 tRNA (N6-isopentenyl adenosine(37)-C2)-methylthiotransferase MiaB [Actinomycetota bacterium]